MPTLTCPHCQTPQAVSDEIFQKNLGKKCRCRQCQKTFTIEASAPPPPAESEGFGDFDFLNDDSPAPASPPPPPPAPAKSKAAAKPAAPAPVAAPSPLAADEPDFSSLLGGQESPPVADFPDFASPEPAFAPIADTPEFPSFDDVAPAPAAAIAAPPKAKAPLTRQPQPAEEEEEGDDVARLPDRPALKTIATVLRIIAWVHVLFIGLAVLLGLFAVSQSPSMQAKISAFASILMATLMLSASALFWFAYAELIHLGLGMEARLHEISRRIRTRS